MFSFLLSLLISQPAGFCDCEAPKVESFLPFEGQESTTGGTYFEAKVSDNVKIETVRLFIDGHENSEIKIAPPYSWLIDGLSVGSHDYFFSAVDSIGLRADSAKRVFFLKPFPTLPPTPSPTPTPSPSLAPTSTPAPSNGSQGEDDTCLGLNLKRWPKDASGWTIPTPAEKKIFVSKLGTLPAGATAGSLAATTLAAGAALLVKGKAYHLLLNRGETFEGVSIDGKLSGADADHLMIIGAYGSGARPKIIFKGLTSLILANAGSNVALMDLDLDGFQGTAHAGLRMVQNAGKNMLIEGVKISGFQNGIAADYQSPDEKASFENLVIRRSVIIDNFSKSSGHSQGLYLAKAKGFLVEESIFDHNGWKNNGGGEADRSQTGFGAPTIFNHNLYLQSEAQCYVYQKNVSVRGSATGLQLRSGGVIEDSLFAMNPNQVNFGAVNGGSVQALHIPPGVSGRMVRNVLLQSVDISPSLKRGGDSTVGNILHAVFSDNIIAHQGAGFIFRGFANGIGMHSFQFKKNIFFDMPSSVSFQGSAYGPVNLKAETMTGPNENGVIVTRSVSSVFSPSGTRLITGLESGIAGKFSPRSISDSGFIVDGNIFQTSLTTFLNLTTPPKPSVILKNMQKANVKFLNPNRKIDQAYIDKIRNLNRSNWDPSLLAPAMNGWVRDGFTIQP